MSLGKIDGASFFTRSFDAVIVREDLMSQDITRQIPALMQAVALMTIGKDMSPLFTEVSSLTSSSNTTLKRLTYLYLQQYSRIQPEKAVLQAGAFVRDSLQESPLVRGASIRAMTSLQVAAINDFVKSPLRRLLEDPDPYVRRNAVLGFLKSISVSHALLNSGLLEQVVGMLKDPSPCVVAACIITLQELSHRGITTCTAKDFSNVKSHLVSLLDTATEWPAFYILEGLCETFTEDTCEDPVVFLKENEDVIMRVLPFTCYASPALVLAASKVLCQFLLCCERCLPKRERWEIEERFAPSLVRALVSLLGTSRYEVRYVVLRNIQLLLHASLNRYFHAHIASFRILFDDPVYVKLEKVRCLVGLANEDCGSSIIEELYAHAISSNVDLVRESIRSIGTVAANVENLAESTIRRLENLVESKVPKVVAEAVVVLHNLLRVYPHHFPSVIHILRGALPFVTRTEAICAIIWAVGEDNVQEHISDSVAFVQQFVDSFETHPQDLQLTILSTVAKLYIHAEAEEDKKTMTLAVEKVLNEAVHSLKPMIRDRAFFYLRLLFLDPVTARRVLCSEDGSLSAPKFDSVDKSTVNRMLCTMGTLVSMEKKPITVILQGESTDMYAEDGDSGSDVDDEQGLDDLHHDREMEAQDENENGSFGEVMPLVPRERGGTGAYSTPTTMSTLTTVLAPEDSNGVRVEMMWDQLASKLVLVVRVSIAQGEDYVSQAVVDDLQINRNAFGLGVAQVFPVTRVTSESSAEVNVIVGSNNQFRPTAGVEVAISVQPIGIRHFLAPPIPPVYLLLPPTHIEKQAYVELRQRFTAPAWTLPPSTNPIYCNPARLSVNLFRMFSLTLVHHSSEQNLNGYFLFGETTSHEQLLYELTIKDDSVIVCSVYTERPTVAFFFGDYLTQLLRRAQ